MMTLKEYRDRAKLSQRAFAALVEVDASVISKLEAGKVKPGLVLACRIAEQTGQAVPVTTWVQSRSPAASAPLSEAS